MQNISDNIRKIKRSDPVRNNANEDYNRHTMSDSNPKKDRSMYTSESDAEQIISMYMEIHK